jgi:hypothetical protein
MVQEDISKKMLYSFPMAVIIKFHKLGELKDKCIASQFWKIEVKIKVSPGLGPSVGWEGKICSWPLSFTEAHRLLCSPCFSSYHLL